MPQQLSSDAVTDRERQYRLIQTIFTRVPPELISIPDRTSGTVTFTGVHLDTLLDTYPHDPNGTPCQYDSYLVDSLLELPPVPGETHHAVILSRVHNPQAPDDRRWWGHSTRRVSLTSHPMPTWDNPTAAGLIALQERDAAVAEERTARTDAL